MIDPMSLSLLAVQLFPACESWGDREQAEVAVDQAAKIFDAARKRASELNAGAAPALRKREEDGPFTGQFSPVG